MQFIDELRLVDMGLNISESKERQYIPRIFVDKHFQFSPRVDLESWAIHRANQEQLKSIQSQHQNQPQTVKSQNVRHAVRVRKRSKCEMLGRLNE